MRAFRTVIAAIASVAVVVAVVALAHLGSGSAGVEVPPATSSPIVGSGVFIEPAAATSARAHGFASTTRP